MKITNWKQYFACFQFPSQIEFWKQFLFSIYFGLPNKFFSLKNRKLFSKIENKRKKQLTNILLVSWFDNKEHHLPKKKKSSLLFFKIDENIIYNNLNVGQKNLIILWSLLSGRLWSLKFQVSTSSSILLAIPLKKGILSSKADYAHLQRAFDERY